MLVNYKRTREGRGGPLSCSGSVESSFIDMDFVLSGQWRVLSRPAGGDFLLMRRGRVLALPERAGRNRLGSVHVDPNGTYSLRVTVEPE